MSIFVSIILGLIQGLTEFIPVSSSGHLELAQQFLGGRGEDFHYFLELINFGTLLALIIYYRKRIKQILEDIFRKHNYRLAINVIITCLPAGLAGLLLSDFIEENPFFSSLWTIAIAMGVVGLLMILSDKLPHLSKLKDESKLTRERALGIGFSQVFALIPGVSRSGSTILGGRMMGLDSKSAADYSFLVSIPLMTAVCLKTLISSSARAYLIENIGVLTISNIVAFVSGLLAVNFVMNYLKKPGALKTFGYYRLFLSTVVIIILLINS
ncbi:MAG: undecaprenyl-diphosphate phosphatase [Candidatus Saccharibacteria bacterium]|nr:undecaprenyl-diphosphate phosphatase [Candidatus Saccharibacteria bacterium]